MPSTAQITRLLKTAVEHQRAGRFGEAEPLYRQVLAAQPRNTDALYLLGLITQHTKRYTESAELFRRAVHEQPRNAKYLVNLGLCLGGMGLGKTKESIDALRRAVAADPNIPEAWSNLGNEYRNSFIFDQAIDCYQRALKLRPNFADAQCNLGVALQESLSNLAPAVEALEKAIAMDPSFATAHWNLGFCLLLMGDYSRGLAEYEWRFRTNTVSFPRQFRRPRWEGEPLAGKTLFLHAEQGLGDSIHMARFIPILANQGAAVILEVPAPLVPFLAQTAGLAKIIPGGRPPPEFDFHCPLMSLPLLLKTTLQTIPATIPYLHPDPQLAELWSARIPPEPGITRVGLVWAGQPNNKNDHVRSIRLEQLAPLANIKNVRFYSVQKGAASQQLQNPPPGLTLTDLTSDLHNFADTAALVSNLDLIITVDTSVAHVAGSIGKPAWVLLPFRPDWRWLLGRSDSPWYPTLRLFRQKIARSWTEPIEEVKNELQALASAMYAQT